MPCTTFVLSVVVATALRPASPLLPLALFAGGLALPRTAAGTVCAAALGLLLVWGGEPSNGAASPTGPVSALGARTGPWQRDAYGWSCPARLSTVVSGRHAQRLKRPVRLILSGAQEPPAGRAFAARGQLDQGPLFFNGGPVRSSPLRLRVKSRRLIRFDAGEDWRRRFHALGLDRREDSDGVALARALALGDSSGLDRPIVQALRRAGLGHLLALSGLHVGLVGVMALWLGRFAIGWRSAPWLWWLPALAALGFVALVGARPALARSSCMAVASCLAMTGGRRPQAWNALALALALLVAWEPSLVGTLGLWLSSAATAGLLFEARLGRGGALVRTLRLSLAAQLATLPWTAPHFALLTPAAALHNLWGVPWAAAFLGLAIIWLALGALWPDGGAMLEPALNVAAEPLRWAARLRAGPWWSVPTTLSVVPAAVCSGLGLLALARRGPVRWVAVAAAAATVAVSFAPEGPSSRYPELVMLDVGQGEAMLLRDGRRAVLIDGGGWAFGDFGGRVLLPALARLGVRRLDAIVLTHPDVDHCAGLVDVTAYFRVEELWSASGWPAAGCATELIVATGLRWRPMWAGRRRQVGRWRVDVLHPGPGSRGGGNDRSLVLRVEALGFRALLTGDLEASGEQRLVRRWTREELAADLLKVGHHGSKSSSTALLLEQVSPRLGWISAGRGNRYGHPHPSVVRRLETAGARLLRTDRDGQLQLWIDRSGTAHLTTPVAPASRPRPR